MRGGDAAGGWRERAELGMALAGVLLAAGCTGGPAQSPSGPGSSAPPSHTAAWASPDPTPAATASVAPAPDTTPTPAPSDPAPSPPDGPTLPPLPSEPPAATLRGLEGAAAAGRLGSYTWGSFGSDAPWIVGKAVGHSQPGAPLDVSVGADATVSWSAQWAPVSAGSAGDPTDGGSGTGPVVVHAPSTSGDWSLAVTVTFAPAYNAVYFWHLTISG